MAPRWAPNVDETRRTGRGIRYHLLHEEAQLRLVHDRNQRHHGRRDRRDEALTGEAGQLNVEA